MICPLSFSDKRHDYIAEKKFHFTEASNRNNNKKKLHANSYRFDLNLYEIKMKKIRVKIMRNQFITSESMVLISARNFDPTVNMMKKSVDFRAPIGFWGSKNKIKGFDAGTPWGWFSCFSV